jgi:hypothetical protein
LAAAEPFLKKKLDYFSLYRVWFYLGNAPLDDDIRNGADSNFPSFACVTGDPACGGVGSRITHFNTDAAIQTRDEPGIGGAEAPVRT